MGWATQTEVLLIVLVFSNWPLTTETLLQESSLAGMPLSEAEYESFFQTLAARHVFHAVCYRRAVYGCFDPAIQALDRYENHGVIPTGWICSDFPDNSSFTGFCDFALYRCSMKKYFAKRVLCPDETTQMSTVVEDNPEGIPDEIVIPTTEQTFELHAGPPITSTESLPGSLASPTMAATEISRTPLLTTTTKAPLAKLLSSSAVETASKLVAQILAAFKAAQKSSSVPATSVLELTPTSTATAAPEASSATTMTEEFLNELTSTATIIMEPEIQPATIATTNQATAIGHAESFPEHAIVMEHELHPAKMATFAAHTQATIIVNSESFPGHAAVMEHELHPAKMAPVATPKQATAIARTESFPEHAVVMEHELHPAKMATFAAHTQATIIVNSESFPGHAAVMEHELHPAKMATIAAHTQATAIARTESFPEHAVVMEPELHPAKMATIAAHTQATAIARTESFPEHAVVMEPELHPAKMATVAAHTQATAIARTESFPEHAVAMEHELHPAKMATVAAHTQATAIALTEFFPEHGIITEPELHSAKMVTTAEPTQATITASTESFPGLAIVMEPEIHLATITATTQATAIAPTESFPEHAIVMEPELQPAKMATMAAPTQATTIALTKSFSELATATELLPESPSGTTTHTTTTAFDTGTCVVDYPEPLETSTDSTSSTATAAPSSTSLLPIHTASTPTKATTSATSFTTTTPSWPLVPGLNVPLPFPPLQSNSTLRILILSFFRNKDVKDGGTAGINALVQAALGSGNIVQQEEIRNPLPTNALKDLLFRLQDKGVQQLMHKMQNGISGEEQKPQLLSSALQLLSALNPRSDFKSKLQR